jgi:hypothetical protein
MDAKLTLRLDESLIEKAKRFAAAHGESVSRLVGKYFAVLPPDPEQREKPVPGPRLLALYGILEGMDVDEDDYYRYIEEKHR